MHNVKSYYFTFDIIATVLVRIRARGHLVKFLIEGGVNLISVRSVPEVCVCEGERGVNVVH